MFTDCIRNIIAKFYCTNNGSCKSALIWDFAFKLGKNPAYYALVLTYRTTTLLIKENKKPLVILGPILIFHKKVGKTTLSGVGPNLKVLGDNGENSIYVK